MITLYLILKLQTMVKLSQEGQSVVTFLYYKIWGQKQGIYFINQVILILICTPLYSSKIAKLEIFRNFLVKLYYNGNFANDLSFQENLFLELCDAPELS